MTDLGLYNTENTLAFIQLIEVLYRSLDKVLLDGFFYKETKHLKA